MTFSCRIALWFVNSPYSRLPDERNTHAGLGNWEAGRIMCTEWIVPCRGWMPVCGADEPKEQEFGGECMQKGATSKKEDIQLRSERSAECPQKKRREY